MPVTHTPISLKLFRAMTDHLPDHYVLHGRIFDGEEMKNSPIHMACMTDHETVLFLAEEYADIWSPQP